VTYQRLMRRDDVWQRALPSVMNPDRNIRKIRWDAFAIDKN